jgi:hypothetical protein
MFRQKHIQKKRCDEILRHIPSGLVLSDVLGDVVIFPNNGLRLLFDNISKDGNLRNAINVDLTLLSGEDPEFVLPAIWVGIN